MMIPTLILIGESDAWTTADACRKLVAGEDDLGISRQKSDGAAVQLIVYPNAYHGFDVPSLQTPVRYFGHHHEFNKSPLINRATHSANFFVQWLETAHRQDYPIRPNVRSGCAPCKGGAFQWVQALPGIGDVAGD
jgi:dienelactone hydrolase